MKLATFRALDPLFRRGDIERTSNWGCDLLQQENHHETDRTPIAASTTLPIILHEAPGRTTRELSDETLQRLAESTQFVGAKDASVSIARLLHLRPLVPPDFRLLSGEDVTVFAYLLGGGDGGMSVAFNIAPDFFRRISEACSQGDAANVKTLVAHLGPWQLPCI
jgi:4-hydroxy-tetrahydrodipicolinate synthase